MSGPVEQRAAVKRDPRGRFLPGHGGLRPRGARDIGPLAFLDALQADWRAQGPACIERLRREDPVQYLLMMIAIIPRRWGGKGR